MIIDYNERVATAKYLMKLISLYHEMSQIIITFGFIITFT